MKSVLHNTITFNIKLLDMKKITTSKQAKLSKSKKLILIELWRKSHLLNEITRECTKIYPANTDPKFVKAAIYKVCDLGYEIANDFENPKYNEVVAPKIECCANKLKCLWNDANKRGIAPLTETGVILHILSEIKKDLKILKRSSAA